MSQVREECIFFCLGDFQTTIKSFLADKIKIKMYLDKFSNNYNLL